MKTILEQVEEIVGLELMKRGFFVNCTCKYQDDGRISLKSSEFQTTPVLFKRVWVANNFGSYVQDIELNGNTCTEYSMTISVNYETFERGFNAIKLFNITLRLINGEIRVVNIM